jgi:hypothetical protein
VKGHYQYPIPEKKIMDYDWDILIIIDACRYDLFKDVANNYKFIPLENISSIISPGQKTLEWIRNNFGSSSYPDVVYVSGNPFISETYIKKHITNKKIFSHIEPVWDYGWDEKLGTTPAENVTSAALKTYARFRDKRMIIHYVQPHFPFVGKIRLKEDPGMSKENVFGEKTRKDEPFCRVWELFERGVYKREEVWSAYKSNLEYVLVEVGKLVELLEGRIILTSDHGNCFGEYGFYGHSNNIRTKELVKVPWVLLKDSRDNEKRKIVRAVKLISQGFGATQLIFFYSTHIVGKTEIQGIE